VGVTSVQYSFEELSPQLSHVTFCVLDIETAGGSPTGEGITEIGAVKYKGGQEIERFNALIHPGCSIPPFIVTLTGISDHMVRNAPPIADVLPSLIDFIGDSVFVAHNARFDLGFVNAALVSHGYDALTNSVIDTVQLARRLIRNEVPNCKLSTLASCLNLTHQPIHRAMDDVLATGDLLHYLIERAAALGVFYLEDLLALPSISGHPQSKKLAATNNLPRSPGVYMFVDERNAILYVGKATNIRSRVRSYFGTNESRNKVGSLLKLMHSVHYIETPDALTAEVLESRIIGKLRPRYNRAGTRVEKYCYVRFTTDEEWPRLVVTKTPSDKGIFVGPLSTRSAARDIIDAIESVVPLRRCTARLGRNYKVPEDAQVCSAARLGLAQCPCSGTADAATYSELVRRVSDTLLGHSTAVFDQLEAKMQAHSEAQRFEEAAMVRDRITTLKSALRKQEQTKNLLSTGDINIELNNVSYYIQCGVLQHTRYSDQLFTPLISDGINVSDLIAPPTQPHTATGLVRPEAIDEIMCVVRFMNKLHTTSDAV
jgi:DNA polymerase III subunit epsilon